MDVFDDIRKDPLIEELARLIEGGAGAVAAEGLWGSSAPILAAIVAARLGRPLLLVTAHADDADDIRDDIEASTGASPDYLPPLETSAAGLVRTDDELAAERLRLCVALMAGEARRVRGDVNAGPDSVRANGGPASGRSDRMASRASDHSIGRDRPAGGRSPSAREPAAECVSHADSSATPLYVAPILALMQPVPSAESIRSSSLDVAVGQTVDPDAIADWLVRSGFSKCDAVEMPGDFARRGGIIDVFSNAHTDAVRIEFFGEQVESIRYFDAGTQRSSHALQAVQLPAFSLQSKPEKVPAASDTSDDARPARRTSKPATRTGDTCSFLSHLPPNTLIAFIEPTEVQELGRTYLLRLGEQAGVITADAVFRRANDFAQLHLHRFNGVLPDAIRFDTSSLVQFEARPAEPLRPLAELAREGDVVVLCDNAAEQERLRELLEQGGEGTTGRMGDTTGRRASEASEATTTPAGRVVDDAAAAPPPPDTRALADDSELAAALRRVQTSLGIIRHGFRWRKTAYLPHHELFHRYRQRRTLRRVAPSRPIDTFFDLNPGDHVVHVLHGIGRFIGLKTMEHEGRLDEYLALEFAGKAVVHVPISQIHVVQKYIGSVRGRPKLSSLGGSSWKKTRERVAEAVTDLAAELLAVQARREAEPGIAYPHDTDWQREFEGSFIYQETEDQLRAIVEVKTDMTRPRPMDRLLCGDVGYGKTEIAMRAAFKAVEYGKQVAVLVPTTVLAEQHMETFRERIADYPFAVEGLSRFKSAGEQRKILDRTRRGEVDILIGTHRLLSQDVHFADLGLVIIDEEQRFGVEAKERLKRLRATVDVLTMTATPIPRTLHMSMLGMRDISSLQTAPVDRRAIITQVRMWDDALIREAIVRELNRDGQVYFVHNFVRDIHEVANHLRTLVPEARFVVGHGQMAGAELEDVMLRFFHREADVLVSTNIIESGIDVASANTIFINRADRFGLADLHQLRGRVGRSRHRAYGYLLLSPKHPLNDNAARRLKAIEHYSELGAGFQIAMRDLEIRGAGNILGPEQSGHIEAVGYEMYCQLLDQAVKRMRNEPTPPDRHVNLDLGVSASIPRAYIRADKQRMEVYKRLTTCRTVAEIDVLRTDLRDAFGPPPEAVETLLLLAEIRALASPWGIRSMVLVEPDVVFSFDDLQKIQPLFVDGAGSPRVPDPKTIHWRLPKRYLEMPTLLTVLRKQLGRTPGAARVLAGGSGQAGSLRS